MSGPYGRPADEVRFDVVALGEVMLRLDPGEGRIRTAREFRIWEGLASRLGHGVDGWTLETGPITDRSVLPMRSFVQTPMRHGRLFLAGDSAHIVPPTGAKGLNLAVADVRRLSDGLARFFKSGETDLLEGYSDACQRRVWRSVVQG